MKYAAGVKPALIQMTDNIKLPDGLPPSVEVGYIDRIDEKKSNRGNKYYADILMRLPRFSQGRTSYTLVPFYFGPKLWGLHKKNLVKGSLWFVQFRISGNESNGVHYCNARVIKAHMYNPVPTQVKNDSKEKRTSQSTRIKRLSSTGLKSSGAITNFIDTELDF